MASQLFKLSILYHSFLSWEMENLHFCPQCDSIRRKGVNFMGYYGCHLSASGGNAAMVKTALSIGANTFAFFTRNPRGSKAKQEDPADCARAAAMLEEHGFGKLVAHGA